MTLTNVSATKLPGSAPRERSKSQQAELSRRAQTTRWVGRASLALPLVGLAAGAWLLSRGREQRAAAYGLLGSSVGLGVLRWQLQRLVTEKIPYVVEARLDDIEYRRYPAQVWAETVVEQLPWAETLSEGFRRLAGYIFGDNQARERLELAAPVVSSLAATVQQGSSSGEKLSMTAPVFATLGDDRVGDRTVAFVMPADCELASLPKPRDPRVRLRAIPERWVAALAFSGNYRSGLPQQKREELLSRLKEVGIEARGEVSFAGYDPPSTLPALRRNEVMVELTGPEDAG